jgi:starch phosphorylase
VPIYFLDTDVSHNPKFSQEITNRLYQGNRIFQEMVLGIGGIRALEKLGHTQIQKHHMNEGHSCFLTLELLHKMYESGKDNPNLVKDKCVFTTHTPIKAGHDVFSYEDIYNAFRGCQELLPLHIRELAGQDQFNTTKLAMNLSSCTNAVSKKHGEVTREMFPSNTIISITNGIHVGTWVSPYMAELFDKEIEGWRVDYTKLTQAFKIDNLTLLKTHHKAKEDLIKYVNENSICAKDLNPHVLTIGFARRFVQYKDADLIFKNLNALKELGEEVQFIFAGKAHPHDGIGKDIMRRIINYARELDVDVNIAFLENYNMDIAKLLVGGCNLWLNTPKTPNEASGTSGMKAAINGCLHFSTLDGWAIESFEKDGGGFPIYQYEDFMVTLKYKILPKYYCNYSTSWAHEMKLAIAKAGSYFNTHRMAKEYIKKSYKMNYDELIRGN